MWTHAPLSARQTQAVWSKLAVARWEPSGEKATALTLSLCPRRMWSGRPVSTSQTMAVWSSLPLASCLPSDDQASPWTLPVWPLSSRGWPPAATAQTWTWGDAQPAPARDRPSGDQATV